MDRIINHLRELLYDHDCVIIPGFGGFIAHNEPSSLHPVQHRFNPPGRFILFNTLIDKDDGLLINAVASAESISFNQAKTDVGQLVTDCQYKLNEGESIVFRGIGRFFKNRELSIVFTPEDNINFLRKSFGLTQLISPPIHRERVRKRASARYTDRQPHPAGQNVPGSVKWTIITAVPVVLFLLWGILFPSSVSNFYEDHAGFLDRLMPEKIILMHNPTGSPAAMSSVATTPLEELSLPIKHVSSTTVISNDPASENTETQPTAPLMVSPAPAGEVLGINTYRLNYHIIGGVFQSAENAENFVRELQQRGFEAAIAGTNRSGLLRVSYKSFKSKEEAISYLDIIRKNENENAWILKY